MCASCSGANMTRGSVQHLKKGGVGQYEIVRAVCRGHMLQIRQRLTHLGHLPCHCRTLSFGSTAKVLAECNLEYYRISGCAVGTAPALHTGQEEGCRHKCRLSGADSAISMQGRLAVPALADVSR